MWQELTDRGTEVLFNDEIARFNGLKKLEGIQLKSGEQIDCQGSSSGYRHRSQSELAQSIQLSCKRGVVVNEYLQTSGS